MPSAPATTGRDGTTRALGRPEEARTHWLEALAIFQRRLQPTDADQVRGLLADLPTQPSLTLPPQSLPERDL